LTSTSVLKTALLLGVVAPLAGGAVGVVVSLFRLTLDAAARMRDSVLELTSKAPAGAGQIALVVAVIGASACMVALAAFLVRRFCPEAAGSGIPRVQSVLAGELPPAPARVVPVKFAAGALAIAPGLALGREGPSVQMGASIAYHMSRVFSVDATTSLNLLAAGGGAGFAAAFSAPLAGSLFVVEALLKRFEPLTAMMSLAAAAGASWVVHVLCGATSDITVGALGAPSLTMSFYCILLGLLAGAAGIVYHYTLLGALNLSDRVRLSPVLRAGTVGAVFGVIAIFSTSLVGPGSDAVRNALAGHGEFQVLPLLFALRLLLIAGSVAAGTPGGLLVPLLSLGAELGLMFSLLCGIGISGDAVPSSGFVLVGMAALFAAIVRTPVTAIVLVMEMTSNVTMALPMTCAVFAATLVPTLLGVPSILDALRTRPAATSREEAASR